MDKPEALSMAFAEFSVKATQFADSVLNEGKRLLLDQLACQIAFAKLPWSLAFRDAVLALGAAAAKGPATVVFHGDKLALDDAAFLNSAFGHGGEFDDTQLGSHTHSGAAVIPPVLAIAELRDLSGRQALEAIIVGVEVMVRIGAAAAPELDERGFHAPPVVGPFGSAAACGRALGLNAERCAQALAIAGSHSGGTRQYTRSGGSVKRAHCAIPAASGLRSAFMARAGITGPKDVLEGDRGIFALFAGAHDVSHAAVGLGREYLLLETAYKPITSPWPSHAPLEALGLLVDERRFDPRRIRAIIVGSSSQAINNIKTIRMPTDIMEAQYSLAFGCAVRLLRGGNGIHDYRVDDLQNPDFLALAKKVEFKIDPQCDAERLRLKNRAAVVEVVMDDGTRFEKRVQFSKGHPRNPLSNDELTRKFLEFVTPFIGDSRAKAISNFVWNIEDERSCARLVAMTVPDR